MPRGRPRVDEAQRRLSIVDAGRACFVELGFETTTSDLIIERCRVSKRTFYENFEDKATLLVELLELDTRRLLNVPTDAIDPVTFADALSAMFFVRLPDLEFQSDRYFLLLAAWQARDRVAILGQQFEVARNQLEQWFTLQPSELGARITEPMAMAAMVLNVGFGRSPVGQATAESRKEHASFLRACFATLSKAFS